MKRVILAGLLSGLAFFMWGFLYWAASPIAKKILAPVPGGDAVIAQMQSSGAESGVYMFPSSEEQEKPENRDKPYFSLLIYRTGHGVSMPMAICRGLGISLLLGWLLAALVSCMASRQRGFGGRVMMCVMLGLIYALAGPLVDWNWFSWPSNYLIFRFIDVIGGFTVLGLVIAAIVKPCDHKECGAAPAA